MQHLSPAMPSAGEMNMKAHPIASLLVAITAASCASAELPAPAPQQAAEVVDFWREAGPSLWFAKDAAFDRRFRERFLPLHDAAARGALDDWTKTPDGALALVILLDQYPRNAFRGTPRMYATDDMARAAARRAIAAGHDRAPEHDMQKFFYLPFAHSESLADQDFAVSLCARLGGRDLTQAQHHREIIARFGRFPHRNAILGRAMRPEEQTYLDSGGFRG
jgi:uncharacterized protein (DUF924 family)